MLVGDFPTHIRFQFLARKAPTHPRLDLCCLTVLSDSLGHHESLVEPFLLPAMLVAPALLELPALRLLGHPESLVEPFMLPAMLVTHLAPQHVTTHRNDGRHLVDSSLRVTTDHPCF